jgi:hypothetical protein
LKISILFDETIPFTTISPMETIRDVHGDLFPRRFLAA